MVWGVISFTGLRPVLVIVPFQGFDGMGVISFTGLRPVLMIAPLQGFDGMGYDSVFENIECVVIMSKRHYNNMLLFGGFSVLNECELAVDELPGGEDVAVYIALQDEAEVFHKFCVACGVEVPTVAV